MQHLVNKYIITNFIYGTGPFLRTTEIAIAVNKQVKNPYGIIVPWVMGEKQRKIMLEEFTDQADNIFLDKQLGDILNTVFYNEKGYEDSLRMWIENYEEKSREAQLYLKGTLSTETLSGKKVEINGKYIEIEINRSPRIKFGIEKSFGVTFGCTSEILKKVLDLPHDIVSIDRNLVRKAIPISEELEKNKLTFISYPGTFSYLNQEKNIETPPTSCTSKCLCPSVRRDASLTTAKASGKISFKVFPDSICFLNSVVFALSTSSDRDFIFSSKELIVTTVF